MLQERNSPSSKGEVTPRDLTRGGSLPVCSAHCSGFLKPLRARSGVGGQSSVLVLTESPSSQGTGKDRLQTRGGWQTHENATVLPSTLVYLYCVFSIHGTSDWESGGTIHLSD